MRTTRFRNHGPVPTDERSPTARALQCLGLVQARPGSTAAELAARLGVTSRAVRRYVAILREAEIPVEAVTGPYGGYRVGRGVRMPPLLFSEGEALALTMAAMAEVSDRQDDPVARALTKLVQTLPGQVGEQAAAMWGHAATAPGRSDARPDPATSGALVAVVAERRRARVGYRSAPGTVLRRTVDPWAVVARRGLWYLLCRDHAAQAVRTYRVDRVLDVTPLPERFEPPPDLDPVALVEQHLGSDRRFTATVRFEAPLVRVRRYVGPVMGRLEPDGDGCLLAGTTDNPAMYAGEWLAAVPLPFRVLGGPELAAAVTEVAQRLARAVD